MSLTLDQQVKWVFRINTVINLALSIRGILDPEGMAALFGGPVPTYPFLIRLWSGLVFMFGLMFWETSRDVRKKSVLIKYNWIEKVITASAVTLGFLAGDVPAKLMLLIVFTNWLWIPFILYYNIRLSRDMKARANQKHDVSWPHHASGSPTLASGSIADPNSQPTLPGHGNRSVKRRCWTRPQDGSHFPSLHWREGTRTRALDSSKSGLLWRWALWPTAES